jgi:uncharacterized protein (TIGR01244 family)
MTDFRQVTDSYAVSPQIDPADIAEAKARGFVMVINNRPDGEAPDQPTSAEMEAVAKAAGLAYRHIPVRGGPTPEQAAEQAEAIAEAGGPVLAFCRSGTRSIVTWSQAAAKEAGLGRDEIVAKGAAAGYDLSGVV